MNRGGNFFPDWPRTQQEAEVEARRRWGPTAQAWWNPKDWRAPFRVGIMTADRRGGARAVVLGRGLTWERAFFSSERRERGDVGARHRRGRERLPLPQLFA